MKIYEIGQTVMSKFSHTRFVIAKIDHENKMYIDSDNRALGFNEVYSTKTIL